MSFQAHLKYNELLGRPIVDFADPVCAYGALSETTQEVEKLSEVVLSAEDVTEARLRLENMGYVLEVV
jgi:hypothetical protein